MQHMTPVEMLNELIRLGYITPADDASAISMPSAYQSVPNITVSDTDPAVEDIEKKNA
ncbi:MAG: hypothetical protein OXC10_16610 [Rhodospirillaceae bacterium]|nr:hypothetical protein [Rhodospirillaceae bacterium]